MTLRLVFMGTPDFAVPTLEALAEAGHTVAAVYTRPPAAAGRGLASRPSPVQRVAERLGVQVRSPKSLREPEEAAAFAAVRADAAIVVAYGLLLPRPILDAPRHGCFNLHASLLPRWRGAAPIHRAVMAGDRETGVAVMRMEEGLDTGPVARETRVTIGPDETTGALHDVLAARGARLMVEAMEALEAGTLAVEPQALDGVTYARKIANDEARIDWNRPASGVHDQVRGLSPWPGAFFEADLGRGPERIKLLRTELAQAGGTVPGEILPGHAIACRPGAIRPLLVQRAGRGPVGAAEFWRGARLGPGEFVR